MTKLLKPIFTLLLLALAYPHTSDAKGAKEETYLSQEDFLTQTFNEGVPTPKALWLTKSVKPTVKEILGHDYPAARIRYWRDGNRSAWILEEIGKVKPITTGIVVEDGKIARLKVLVYRESHGWEVKYPFFTDQFKETELTEKKRLNKNIDGIAGATLSVNALKKLSRLALYFHQVTEPKDSEK
ncbi:FMN-binding protein [Pelagicoccus mobilis]|uniref:FMN-binding protein n=1 Tax=Pelagicoccus mobilis TaxID=415221 RepID=A0A934RTU6_9BACT|nr:FMN-binding protein [Pelagicoccus mobilis]MBK1876281.1 FMN-binding protein [Pelagicoccus mobilis]